MGKLSLSELVRQRLLLLNKERRLNQTVLADRLGIEPSAVSKTLNIEGRALDMTFLEAASEVAQVPVAELVVPPGSEVKQLAPDESALLRALRLWPKSVRQSLLGFVTFFAEAETPAQTQTRNLHELWRGMRQNDRDWLYGLAVMMREGLLPPDLREGLADRIEAEARAKRTTPKPPRQR